MVGCLNLLGREGQHPSWCNLWPSPVLSLHSVSLLTNEGSKAYTNALDRILKGTVKVLDRSVTCGTIREENMIIRINFNGLGEEVAAIR